MFNIVLQGTYAVLPQAGEAQLRVFNGFNCEVVVNSREVENTIGPLNFWYVPISSVDGSKTFNINVSDSGEPCGGNVSFTKNLLVTEKQVTQLLIRTQFSFALIN